MTLCSLSAVTSYTAHSHVELWNLPPCSYLILWSVYVCVSVCVCVSVSVCVCVEEGRLDRMQTVSHTTLVSSACHTPQYGRPEGQKKKPVEAVPVCQTRVTQKRGGVSPQQKRGAPPSSRASQSRKQDGRLAEKREGGSFTRTTATVRSRCPCPGAKKEVLVCLWEADPHPHRKANIAKRLLNNSLASSWLMETKWSLWMWQGMTSSHPIHTYCTRTVTRFSGCGQAGRLRLQCGPAWFQGESVRGCRYGEGGGGECEGM